LAVAGTDPYAVVQSISAASGSVRFDIILEGKRQGMTPTPIREGIETPHSASQELGKTRYEEAQGKSRGRQRSSRPVSTGCPPFLRTVRGEVRRKGGDD